MDWGSEQSDGVRVSGVRTCQTPVCALYVVVGASALEVQHGVQPVVPRVEQVSGLVGCVCAAEERVRLLPLCVVCALLEARPSEAIAERSRRHRASASPWARLVR